MGRGAAPATARKVMVVVDPTRESAAALQYALSHAVIEDDEVILLHVDNPNSWRNAISSFLKRPTHQTPNGSSATAAAEGGGGGDVDFLDEMRRACKVAHPKMHVRSLRIEMEGKDKANVIISQTKALGVDLLIIGQRRSLSTAILGYRRSGGSMKGAKVLDTAEYLIENSMCTCVSVQKKGQNAGYLLNTKTHKNFWLLA